jgi:hypothetical protein
MIVTMLTSGASRGGQDLRCCACATSYVRVKRNLMADDPRKKKADGKRKSQQPHELAYRKRKAKMQRGQAKK